MIILNNRLYSCEQCLLRNEGQRCEHIQDTLISVAKTNCIVKSKKGFQGSSQQISGCYRLIITHHPKILKTIQLSKHADEEILFNRQLDVDVTKPIGKHIYILDKYTKVEISTQKDYLDQTFISPFGLSNTPLAHRDGFLNHQYQVATPSSSESFGRSTSNELAEPVIIRPFSHRHVSTTHVLRDTPSFDSVKSHPHTLLPLDDPNMLTLSTGAINIPLEENIQLLDSNNISQKDSKITQIDQFLNETQDFITSFCPSSDSHNKGKE